MTSKQDAIGQLEQAYGSFRGKIAGLPDDAWSEVWLGDWGLSQLLAHMAGWFHEMTAAIERVGKGERPTPPGTDYSNPDPWNAKFAATASPGKNELGIFDLRFKEYVAAANALPEDLYGQNDEGRPKIGNRLLDTAGIHHFAEHGGQLDDWLASRK
jgi:hypothetical protein